MVENQFNTHIKIIWSDNEAEFQMSIFYQSNGALYQLTCIATPPQNALAERKHLLILNIARALKFQSKISMQY